MFAKWLEEYQKLVNETRFVSQLGTFIVSLFAFLSCWHIFYAVSYNPDALNHNGNKILVSIIFHILVGVIFALRFSSLFFDSRKSFWIAQTFWVMSLLTLLGFFTVTRFMLYVSFFKPASEINFGMHHYPKIFLYADYSFEFFASLYLLISPIRQIITALFAFIKSK